MCQTQSDIWYKQKLIRKRKIRSKKFRPKRLKRRRKNFIRFKPPTFRAVVSEGGIQYVKSLVSKKYQDIPICNRDNKLVASSWEELINFAGKDQGMTEILPFDTETSHSKNTIVWHGSLEDGSQKSPQSHFGYRFDENVDCKRWAGSRNAGAQGYASKYVRFGEGHTSGFLNEPLKYNCDEEGIVLCIQISPERIKKKRSKN